MWNRRTRAAVAAALADAFLAGEWSEPALRARAEELFGRRPRWLGRVAGEALAAYRERPADRPREVARFLERLLERPSRDRPPPLHRRFEFVPEMGRTRWPVPPIRTLAALAVNLDLHIGELLWLADTRGLERRVEDEGLRRYRYDWHPRPGSAPRLIERPKRLLKDVQRRILHDVLDRIPAHDAAHGFRRGHSVLTHARRHVGRRVVLRFDLEHFFASVAAGRAYGIFRGAGYPEGVAHALTGLCSNVVPAVVWDRAPAGGADAVAIQARSRLRMHLAGPHLPQGAPTSPALANLCAYRLDARLTGLAASFGGTYSRYADDLAVSGAGRLLATAPTFRRMVAAIVSEEGFRLNDRKSQLMSSAGRQRLCGVVVNERPNVARQEYDLLKAILHDAGRRGPNAANRDGVDDFRAHLLGRIAWVASLNPERGARLRARFDRIVWAGRDA
jgi:RNA-directed DNA polymerase